MIELRSFMKTYLKHEGAQVCQAQIGCKKTEQIDSNVKILRLKENFEIFKKYLSLNKKKL